jgi:hypothetical protein
VAKEVPVSFIDQNVTSGCEKSHKLVISTFLPELCTNHPQQFIVDLPRNHVPGPWTNLTVPVLRQIGKDLSSSFPRNIWIDCRWDGRRVGCCHAMDERAVKRDRHVLCKMMSFWAGTRQARVSRPQTGVDRSIRRLSATSMWNPLGQKSFSRFRQNKLRKFDSPLPRSVTVTVCPPGVNDSQ